MLRNIGNIKILSCGYCTQLERLVSKQGRWKKVRFPARCFLVTLQDGYLLFDSGYSADVGRIMQSWPAWLYKTLVPMAISSSQTAVVQLSALGISKDDIKYIFISHFHADHIGGLRDFPKARFICLQEGYQALKKLSKFRQICKGFVSEFLPDDFEQRAVFVNTSSAQNLNNLTAYPLADLSNMYAVELPGHAKGQLGLWLKNENILLAADAAWRHTNLKPGAEPSSIASLFCEDKMLYLQTLSALAKWAEVRILFTHEEE